MLTGCSALLFYKWLELLLVEGSCLKRVPWWKGLHFHHNNNWKAWTVTGCFLFWLWCMPLSLASLRWWMSNRGRVAQRPNKASQYGITAVTENATLPLLYTSTGVNIMDTLAALSLLFETMTIHKRSSETMTVERTALSGEGGLHVGHAIINT